MDRGTGREILIVGIEPGATEVRSGQAFSGSGGRRLMNWLSSAAVGRDRTEILARAHMTSLCKCNVVDKRSLAQAARNCFPFLQQQIAILTPRVLVTLGAGPLNFIFGTQVELETVVGRTWSESDFGGLFSLLAPPCKILPLPHPSPRSTWLNSPEHEELLRAALRCLALELSNG
jgi:DNA polymerase